MAGILQNTFPKVQIYERFRPCFLLSSIDLYISIYLILLINPFKFFIHNEQRKWIVYVVLVNNCIWMVCL